MKTDPCTVCRRPREEWPAIFKGDAQCSDRCKKLARGETP